MKSQLQRVKYYLSWEDNNIQGLSVAGPNEDELEQHEEICKILFAQRVASDEILKHISNTSHLGHNTYNFLMQ